MEDSGFFFCIFATNRKSMQSCAFVACFDHHEIVRSRNEMLSSLPSLRQPNIRDSRRVTMGEGLYPLVDATAQTFVPLILSLADVVHFEAC